MEFDLARLASLSEAEFHRLLLERMRATGALGDVFPLMVTYNVPLFLLRHLWPARLAEILTGKEMTLALAAAEPGWRGRLENIESEYNQRTGELLYNKNYVIEADHILVLARVHSGEDYCLCWLPRFAEVGERTERPELELSTSTGQSIRHYSIRGRAQIQERDMVAFSRTSYSKLALQIPLRELTSLSLLAAVLLEHQDALHPAMASLRDQILKIRSEGRSPRPAAGAARELLVFFFSQELPREPFWERIRSLFYVT